MSAVTLTVDGVPVRYKVYHEKGRKPKVKLCIPFDDEDVAQERDKRTQSHRPRKLSGKRENNSACILYACKYLSSTRDLQVSHPAHSGRGGGKLAQQHYPIFRELTAVNRYE